jgi:hypothetical protein
LTALGVVAAVAQQEYRLRVTVNLVQVDATVTDSKGDPVPDLKAGDFRGLFRDGVEVWQSAATPVETDATKTAGTFARGSLEVPKGLDAGQYLIRVDIGDKAHPEAIGAWQWAKLTVR